MHVSEFFFYCLLFRLSFNIIFGLECAVFPFFCCCCLCFLLVSLVFFPLQKHSYTRKIILIQWNIRFASCFVAIIVITIFHCISLFLCSIPFLVHMFVSITQLNKKKTQKNHANEEKRIETKTKDSCVGNVTKRLYDRAQHSD